jgi:uncharacterized repeat protein (TIGR02543 family)
VTPPGDPTRTGYTFGGWYTDDGTFEIAYTFTTMPAESFTLYAKWLINGYTITFDSNDGSAVEPITQNYATAVTPPGDPTRTGYTFGGWYTDDGTFENEYVFGTMPADNLTLYAKWTANRYTVGFEGADTDAADYVFGEELILPTPEKDGFVFGGWYDNAEFDGDAVTSVRAGETGSKKFYAKWTAAEKPFYKRWYFVWPAGLVFGFGVPFAVIAAAVKKRRRQK